MMKILPLLTIMILAALATEAQRNSGKTSKGKIYMDDGQKATKTGHEATAIGGGYASLMKPRGNKSRNLETSETKISLPTRFNQREIYIWPDGQKSTVTGHQATAINGGYASLGKKREKKSGTIIGRLSEIPANPDPRRIYNWADGQKATVTGHTATAINGRKQKAVEDDD